MSILDDIDNGDQLLSIAEAGPLFAQTRQPSRVSIWRMIRFGTKLGARTVTLEAIRTNGKIRTTRGAVRRYLAECALAFGGSFAASTVSTPSGKLTSDRQHRAADTRLRSMGY